MKQYRKFYGVLCTSCLLTGVGAASAGTNFATSLPLTAHAAVDEGTYDWFPAIATDDNGAWVVVWDSNDSSLGITGVQGAAVSRSTDDGTTWSTPALLRPEFADDLGSAPSLATDGNGRWIVAWSPGASRVEVTVSDDEALTWGAPQTIASTSGNQAPRMANDGAGTWVVVWSSPDSLSGTIGTDYDILFSRSTDNGNTWSAPAALNTDAAGDGRFFDQEPHLATDGSGTWLVTWSTGLAARSTDNGATWSAPVAINSGGDTDVATDGLGTWVTVRSYQQGSEGYYIGFSRSTDGGATWSADATLHPYFKPNYVGFHELPTVTSRGGGEWQVVWDSLDPLGGSLGFNDADILTSYSRDGGSTWSAPAALTTNARRDGGISDFTATLAISPTGRTVAVWASGDYSDNPAIDFDIHFATADRDCDAVAREDCRVSTESDGSKLQIKDGNGGGDRLSWRMRSSEATSDMALGNPLATDNYVLCLYEKLGGSPGLIAEWDAKAATTCNGEPCWRAEAGEVELKDSSLENGSIKRLKIKGGVDGDGYVRVSVSGPALAPPRLPLDVTSPVRIQLVNIGTNACWEGVHDQADTNDAVRFVSTSD